MRRRIRWANTAMDRAVFQETHAFWSTTLDLVPWSCSDSRHLSGEERTMKAMRYSFPCAIVVLGLIFVLQLQPPQRDISEGLSS